MKNRLDVRSSSYKDGNRNQVLQRRKCSVEENARFLKKHPTSSKYVYNKETLGFRLDTKQEIGVFRDGAEGYFKWFNKQKSAPANRP